MIFDDKIKIVLCVALWAEKDSSAYVAGTPSQQDWSPVPRLLTDPPSRVGRGENEDSVESEANFFQFEEMLFILKLCLFYFFRMKMFSFTDYADIDGGSKILYIFFVILIC